MKKTTPILVIFILVLSAMVWKVAENHNAIKLAKQQQNAHYTSPGLDRSHTQSIYTNESNTEASNRPSTIARDKKLNQTPYFQGETGLGNTG